MARKKMVVDEMIDDVKDAAISIGEAIGMTDPRKVERIVPIPQIDIYCELPFALVEKNSKRLVIEKNTKAVASPKTAAASSKRAAKTGASKPKKKASIKRH